MLTSTPIEPQKARFTKDNVIIKDRHYFAGKDISWNRPAQITDKYYPYFHKQKDANKDKIEDLKNQETLDKEVLEQMRREQIIAKKEETKARYDQRVLERTLIQNKSQQPLKSMPNLDAIDYEEEALDVIAKRIDSSKHLRSNDISWNHLHKASQKYIDQYIRPISLQGETEMINHFKKQLEIERKGEENKLAKRDQNHRAIREVFLSKHEENYEKEKKAGTIPVVSSMTSLPSYNRARARETIPSIQILDEEEELEEPENSKVTAGPSLMTTDGEFKLKYPSSLSNVGDISIRNIPSVTKLYTPQSDRKKESNTEYSELKGMLIKNMDYQVFHKDNALYSTLVNNNQTFKDTLDENRNNRKKISKEKSETSKIDSLNDLSNPRQSEANKKPKLASLSTRDEVFDELDKFDKRFIVKKGFNKTELEKVLVQAHGKNSHV